MKKGLKLESLDGLDTRPTLDRVKESIFSMLFDKTRGAKILDLFAGSGAMGLEALSRGADHGWFCEANRANQKILVSNIAGCGAEKESTVLGRDYKSAIASIVSGSLKLDVVIMDPPYAETGYYETAMMMLQETGLLDEGSIVVAEHLYDNKLSDIYGKLEKIKSKKYGSIGVTVYFYKEF
jgi:16S rRNA (guanine(966)-N(2))-methyltransferase RsmD